jgi:putative redox protein
VAFLSKRFRGAFQKHRISVTARLGLQRRRAVILMSRGGNLFVVRVAVAHSGLQSGSRMTEAKPPMSVELTWSRDLVFNAASAKTQIVTDGGSILGPSPVELLAIGLAGCLSMDVVDIVRKSRHPLTAFRCQFTGERAADHPRRFLKVQLHLHIEGQVPPTVVERAIALSCTKYCSVWNSMRQDIELKTSFDIVP